MIRTFKSYGGSVRYEIAISEIDRVDHQLTLAEHIILRLISEANLELISAPTPRQLLIAAELPIWLLRVRFLKFCCWFARQNYLSTEGKVRGLMAAILPNSTSSAARLLSGSNRILRADEVTATHVGGAGVTQPAASIRSMLFRLESTASLADGTLRIESWWQDGRNHYLVYLPGTQDWSPQPGTNPLNLTSDLQAVGFGQSDSEAAVFAALKTAGAKTGDEVMFVAHSQGGLVAANIAQHPQGFQVSSILSFAAPLAGIAALKNTSFLALEHTNDPVPYLAGKPNPVASNFVTVQSAATVGGMPAHTLTTYSGLASTVDKTQNSTISGARQRFMSLLPLGSSVTVQLIKVRRTPKG